MSVNQNKALKKTSTPSLKKGKHILNGTLIRKLRLEIKKKKDVGLL